MKKLDWEDFVHNVQKWAKERGIYEHSTPEAQLLKTLSEIGELADAYIKDDCSAIRDAIGDIAVCLVNYAHISGMNIAKPLCQETLGFSSIESIAFLAGLVGEELHGLSNDFGGLTTVYTDDLANIAALNDYDFMECCTAAWNEIKDRKGRMVAGGAFVKDFK